MKTPGLEIKATYTLAEFARLIGRPYSTVHREAQKGKLQTVMVGEKQLVPLVVMLPLWESVRLAAALSAMNAA